MTDVKKKATLKIPDEVHPESGLSSAAQTPYNVIGVKNADLNNNFTEGVKKEKVKFIPADGQMPIVLNNDIRILSKPKQIKYVHLNLQSPRMKQAMETVGFLKEDLDTKKTKEDFAYSTKLPGQMMTAADYDAAVVDLRFRHY